MRSGSQKSTQLLAQQFLVREMDTRSTQTKGRIRLVQCTDEGFQGRKRLISTCIKCARNDDSSQRPGPCKCLKKINVAGVLFFLCGEDGPATKEELCA